MKGFLKSFKLILAAATATVAVKLQLLKFKQSIVGLPITSIWPGVIILLSFIFALKIVISNEPSCSGSSLTAARLLSKNKDIDRPAEAGLDINTDFDIPSILEYGDVLQLSCSPLQNILNNEIAILLLILIHMFIIIMIFVNKFYVSGSLNLISKLFSNSKLLVKFEKYKNIMDKFSNRFLNLLLVINITFIIAYILLLLYVNIKLSSNLDDFIDVHNDMKKGIILFINSKFLFCLDNKHRNSCSCLSCCNSESYYYSRSRKSWASASSIAAGPSLIGFCLKPISALADIVDSAAALAVKLLQVVASLGLVDD